VVDEDRAVAVAIEGDTQRAAVSTTICAKPLRVRRIRSAG
jgi:hypothetical protein